jgi:hypothetical protein
MGNSKTRKKIRKSDYFRVLVTETLPYETPIIFSNEGLYNNITRKGLLNPVTNTLIQRLVKGLHRNNPDTKPYKYKVRKNQVEYRQLCLLHPISQLQMKEFYQKYENLILHFCRRSPVSIRAPHDIAGTFYSKASWENIHQYRSDSIVERPQDPFTKYSPSYFSYRDFDRLYKFFDSGDFFELEKRFAVLWTLDVSRCFDSIYTHCLSWALKDKPFTKKHRSISSTFAQAFDQLMQRANHSETHGIVIGPEISRIFAELLLQSVDLQVISKLSGHSLELERDYAIRRYVDDVFIFANNADIAGQVYDQYNDALMAVNLQANNSKRTQSERPFITQKSRIIREASQGANDFFTKFLAESGDGTTLVPNKIFHRWRLTRGFLEKVKSLCSYNNVSYFELSSYLISVFTERVKKFANIDLSEASDEILLRYQNAAIVFLDVLYFLYSVSPSVSASYKLCTSIIVLIRFSEKYLSTHEHTVKQRIFEHTESLLRTGNLERTSTVEGFISLEVLNVVLAIRELGEHYRLPERTVEKQFLQESRFSYFSVVSGLFYIGNDPEYKHILIKLIGSVERRLSDLSEITTDAALACLFLDMTSCPYILPARKRVWIKRLYAALNEPMPPADEVEEFINQSSQHYWFVNWGELDLLNSLERKELKRAY